MHQKSSINNLPSSRLESNPQMEGKSPPPFSLKASSAAEDGNGSGNVSADLRYGQQITYLNQEPVQEKGKRVMGNTTVGVVVENPSAISADGGYKLSADVICWPTIEICPKDKPTSHGLLNIDDENSPLITAQNYMQVAKDMQPDESGHTHAAKYWSHPLTKLHEEVHAQHMFSKGESLLKDTERNLEEMNVSSESSGVTALEEVGSELMDEIDYAVKMDAPEEKAYGAIRPEYVRLSNAILKKGNAGGYH